MSKSKQVRGWKPDMERVEIFDEKWCFHWNMYKLGTTKSKVHEISSNIYLEMNIDYELFNFLKESCWEEVSVTRNNLSYRCSLCEESFDFIRLYRPERAEMNIDHVHDEFRQLFEISRLGGVGD